MQVETADWPILHDSGPDRLVLRDGTVASCRPAVADDESAVQAFFHHLTPESRHNRFFTAAEPPVTLVSRFCNSSDPAQGLTLIAFRQQRAELGIIAIASYSVVAPRSAEVAFAVADGMHGKGLGTALLERLATTASANGIDTFVAATLAGNREMLEVFRDSGFEMRANTEQGEVAVRLDLRHTAHAADAINERNRAATVASLKPLLRPRSVAVIGVSRNPTNLGRRVFDALGRAGFNGPIFAVNRSAAAIDGHPSYSSILDVPGPIDLAVIATPRADVLGVVDDCAAAAVKSLVIISAGFAERDDEGRRMQRELLNKTRELGLRVIGPNCMGILNADPQIRLNASLAEDLPPAGRVAIASQSGGIGLALLRLASERQLGISSFVSLGNKADVSGNDLLQWAESDPNTSVVLLYLESFGNPRRFGQLARRIGHRKPIIVVKAGRTPSGNRAAGSHTAGMASSETAVEALLRQAGVIRATTIDEMFDVAQCLDLQPLPSGSRVGIITNAGGPGILAADACEAAGLTVPSFSDATRALLSAKLSGNASVGNPVDLVASAGAQAYEHAISAALASPDIDSLVVIYTEIARDQTASILRSISQGIAAARAAGVSNKPIVACIVGSANQRIELTAATERIPTYSFPENAARALGHAAAYARWRAMPPSLFSSFDDVRADEARAFCQAVVARRGESWLSGAELKKVLSAFGIALIDSASVQSEDDAAAAAARLGYPVAMKIDSRTIVHKTDVGGVRLDLKDETQVRKTFRELAGRFPEIGAGEGSVQLQPMLSGIELIAGISREGAHAALIAFGRGGVDAELLRDVAFRMAPLNGSDVASMIHEIRSFPLLEGYRGRPPADVDAIKELVLRLSSLAEAIPQIRELDLNPVICLPKGKGYRIVDARARVAPPVQTQ
ncbi:MAG TPA: GNAT family N-acetyltransferase [Vicinamibacterales bacterium]|nr:GNAT family N-acetyltransferase [Vicinamibacterales bacterium]